MDLEDATLYWQHFQSFFSLQAVTCCWQHLLTWWRHTTQQWRHHYIHLQTQAAPAWNQTTCSKCYATSAPLPRRNQTWSMNSGQHSTTVFPATTLVPHNRSKVSMTRWVIAPAAPGSPLSATIHTCTRSTSVTSDASAGTVWTRLRISVSAYMSVSQCYTRMDVLLMVCVATVTSSTVRLWAAHVVGRVPIPGVRVAMRITLPAQDLFKMALFNSAERYL